MLWISWMFYSKNSLTWEKYPIYLHHKAHGQEFKTKVHHVWSLEKAKAHLENYAWLIKQIKEIKLSKFYYENFKHTEKWIVQWIVYSYLYSTINILYLVYHMSIHISIPLYDPIFNQLKNIYWKKD